MVNHKARITAGPIITAAGLALAACSSNPFASTEDDYARRVALSRLREAPGFEIKQHARPDPVNIDDGDAVVADVLASRSKFEGLATAPLTIEEVRASTLANNLDLRVALIDPTIAAERVTEEDARFTSVFTLRADHTDAEFPTGSTLASSTQRSTNAGAGVRIPTRTGGSVTVDVVGARDDVGNSFTFLNPSYESDAQISISHPLLRGAGRRVTTAPVRIAGYEEQAAEARTKLEVLRQLTEAERAYWRLYQARQELDVRLQQFDIAREQLDRAGRRVREGNSPEVEIDRARAGAAQRLEAIVIADNLVLLRQRELKQIVNAPGLEVDTPVLILPATPPDPVEYVFDTGELQRAAVANRAELLELELRLAADAVNIGVARNDLLPLVNLTYRYRLNGLADSPPSAVEQNFRWQYPDWTIGVSAEVPLDNEEARSRLRQALLARMQRAATRELREQLIRREVLDAADSLHAGWQRILAARQATIAAGRALASEQRQFDLGRSTSNDVLDASSLLADAQVAEVRALADYQISQIDLAFASGTMLGASRVSFEPAPTADINRPDPPERIGDR